VGGWRRRETRRAATESENAVLAAASTVPNAKRKITVVQNIYSMSIVGLAAMIVVCIRHSHHATGKPSAAGSSEKHGLGFWEPRL